MGRVRLRSQNRLAPFMAPLPPMFLVCHRYLNVRNLNDYLWHGGKGRGKGRLHHGSGWRFFTALFLFPFFLPLGFLLSFLPFALLLIPPFFGPLSHWADLLMALMAQLATSATRGCARTRPILSRFPVNELGAGGDVGGRGSRRLHSRRRAAKKFFGPW